MAKSLVYVLVPYSVGAANVSDHANRLLESHALSDEHTGGRYDYLCRLGPIFDDPITEGSLPNAQKRRLSGYVCDVGRLPLEPMPAVIVTPDGAWHACDTPDVATGCAALLAAHLHCWVVAVWAHS